MEPGTTDAMLANVLAWLAIHHPHLRGLRVRIDCDGGTEIVHTLPARLTQTSAAGSPVAVQIPAVAKPASLQEAITTAIICAGQRLPATEVARQVETLFPSRWEHRSIVNECSRMAATGKLHHLPKDPGDGFEAGYGVEEWARKVHAGDDSQNQ